MDEERMWRLAKIELNRIYDSCNLWDKKARQMRWESLELAPPKDFFEFIEWAKVERERLELIYREKTKAHSRQESVISSKENE